MLDKPANTTGLFIYDGKAYSKKNIKNCQIKGCLPPGIFLILIF